MYTSNNFSSTEDDNIELTEEMKIILDERLLEDDAEYLKAEESIIQMKDKYKIGKP
jgi:hypothetical protein